MNKTGVCWWVKDTQRVSAKCEASSEAMGDVGPLVSTQQCPDPHTQLKKKTAVSAPFQLLKQLDAFFLCVCVCIAV